MRWAFLIDENLEPQVAHILENEGFEAEYVGEALFLGAQDIPDILPYVNQNELIVVTADVKNFAPLSDSEHEGVFFLDKQRTSAYEIASGILRLVDAYDTPQNMNGKRENLDQWIR